MNKKPPSVRASINAGIKRFVRSKGSTDGEYDRAMTALEKANEAIAQRKKVTLPSVWKKP
jgi:hypothetical protein